MRRFVVVGAGAVGSVIAALLLEAGQDVALVATERRARELAERGLRVVTGEGVLEHRPVTVSDIAELAFDADTAILLTLKTQHLAEWLRSDGLRRARTAEGELVLDAVPIVTMQNGLNGELAVARLFRRVYGSVVYIAANYLPGGDVISGRAPVHVLLALGAFPADPSGADETAERLRAGLEASPAILVQASPTIAAWKAAKLVRNVSNGMDLFDGTEEQLAGYSARLADEAAAVLAALPLPGVDGSTEWGFDISGFVRDPRSGIQDGQRSMWQNANRLDPDSEVDFLNGEVRLWGSITGIPTPANDRLQRVLGEHWHRFAAGGSAARLPFALLEGPDAGAAS